MSTMYVRFEGGNGSHWYEFIDDVATRAVTVQQERRTFTREPLALGDQPLSRLLPIWEEVTAQRFETEWRLAWSDGVERASPWQPVSDIAPAESVHRSWPVKATALLIASGVPITEPRRPGGTPGDYMDDILRDGWHLLFLPFHDLDRPVPEPHQKAAVAELNATRRWALVVEMVRYGEEKLAYLRALGDEVPIPNDLTVFVEPTGDLGRKAVSQFPGSELVGRDDLTVRLRELRAERMESSG
jgi:hypothetical protein